MKNFILSEITYSDIKDQEIDLAILPWGATEAHNYHLPYSTDTIESGYIAAKAAEKAAGSGSKIMVLPTVPYGVNTGQSDIKLCMNIMPSTQGAIINDIVFILHKQGIRKLLILNGHGGNDFKPIIRETGSKYPGMILATANWYEAIGKKDYFDNPGEHADEMETSIMLFIAPHLVKPPEIAGKGSGKKFTVNAFNEKWAWTERKWSAVTTDTGIGNPELASASKGSRFLDAVIEKVSGLFIEFSGADYNNFYSE